MTTRNASPDSPAMDLPSALSHVDRIRSIVGDEPACLLDFDGTLTPIVDHPDRVVLDPRVRELLARLAARFPVAVISGRDLEDVRRRVDLDSLVYAGSHGFDIAGPGGLRWEQPEARDFLPRLERIAGTLASLTRRVPGTLLERKRFSLALHYRQADPGHVDVMLAEVKRIVEAGNGLRLRGGKCVVEIQPALAWSKGEAVAWFLERLGEDRGAFYIGDDLTDEDAFRALPGNGVGIIVGGGARRTLAGFRLEDTDEVAEFLDACLLQG